MADKKDKKAPATFGSIALQNYGAQRGYEVGQDASLGETLKPAVNLLGEYAKNAQEQQAEFLNGLPEDFKVELLPTSGKEAFTNFASDAKQRYSDAAGVAAKYSANPNSEQYRSAVKDMESIKGSLSNNYDAYAKLADKAQQFIDNKGNIVAPTSKESIINSELAQGDYSNLENTPDGLVYNYTDPITGDVEKIPSSKLFNNNVIDNQLSQNVVDGILKNPYASGVNGNDMEGALQTANVQFQNIISDPQGYRQAVFNGFGGSKTKFIDYYVGEQFITGLVSDDAKIQAASKVFVNGINDINADGKITKDDMQDGVWSFKEGPEGVAAKEIFNAKINDHKDNPNFDVRQQLGEFMNGIAKDKYLEGKANKLKGQTYNLPGFGKGLKHSQVQGLFDKLNNNEVINDGAARGFTEYTPAPGRPGFYTILVENEDGSEGLSELMPRDMVEGFLGINAVRDDFNVDPVKAANAKGTPVMLDLGANDLANKDKEKVDANNDSETTATTTTTTTTDTEENVIAQNIDEIEENIDRDNITEEQVKSARKSIGVSFGNWEKSYNKFPNTIKDADVLSKGLADIDEQLEVLLTADTKEKLEKGKKKTWFGGITRSHMYDRLSKARDKYKKALDKMSGNPLGSKEPASIDSEKLLQEDIPQGTKEQVEIPTSSAKEVEANLEPSIEAIEAGEVELKDTEGNVVVGSKKAVKSKASYNKTLGDSLISNEGFRKDMYYDMATDEDPTAGTATIGYGYTKSALDGKDGVPSWREYWNADGTATGKEMTREVADSIKETIVNRYVKQVNSDIKVDLTESQNNALVDLYYRNGAGNIAKSGILELINAGKIEEAAELIKAGGKNGRLIKAGSKVLKEGDELFEGIVNRNNRAAENLLVGLETQDQTQA